MNTIENMIARMEEAESLLHSVLKTIQPSEDRPLLLKEVFLLHNIKEFLEDE